MPCSPKRKLDLKQRRELGCRANIPEAKSCSHVQKMTNQGLLHEPPILTKSKPLFHTKLHRAAAADRAAAAAEPARAFPKCFPKIAALPPVVWRGLRHAVGAGNPAGE